MSVYSYGVLSAAERGADAEPITPRSLRERALRATLLEHGFTKRAALFGEILALRVVRDWPRSDVMVAIGDLHAAGALRLYVGADAETRVYFDGGAA